MYSFKLLNLIFVLSIFVSCSLPSSDDQKTIKTKQDNLTNEENETNTILTDLTKQKKKHFAIPTCFLTHEYSEDSVASYMLAIKAKYSEIQALEIEPETISIENNGKQGVENEYYYNSQNELVKITVIEEKHNPNSSKYTEYYFDKGNLFFIFVNQAFNNEIVYENEFRYYFENNTLINSFKKEWNSKLTVASINDIKNQPLDNNNVEKYFEEAYNLQNSADANVLANSLGNNYLISFPNFAFVYNRKFLLIEPYTNHALKGEPYEVSPGAGICDVDMDELSFFYKNMIGKEFDIYDEQLNRATITIKSFNVIVAYTPHFGEIQRFNDDEHEESENPTEMFHNTPSKFFVASFDYNEGDKDLVWARLSTLPEVKEINNENSEIHDKFYNQILKSEAYKKIQDEYTIYLQEEYLAEGRQTSFPKKWLDYASKEDIFYSTSKVTASFVHIESGEPCGQPSFGGAIYESLIKIKDETFKISDIISIRGDYLIPIQAIDINNDDIPEFIFKDWWSGTNIIIYYYNQNYQEFGNYIFNYDCGC